MKMLMIKKFYLLTIIFVTGFAFGDEIEIGPATQKNVVHACKKACKLKNLYWTGKETCEYQLQADEYDCKCECVEG